MDDGQLFRETFSGVLTGEYNLAQTKTRFGKLFKVSPAKVCRLFTGKEYILNNNVAEEVAMKFAIRLAEAGKAPSYRIENCWLVGANRTR